MFNGIFFVGNSSDTRKMGRVLDVVCYDLNITKAKGSVTYPLNPSARYLGHHQLYMDTPSQISLHRTHFQRRPLVRSDHSYTVKGLIRVDLSS